MMTYFIVLFGSVLLVLARYLYKSWWYPLSLQYLMNRQGIKGPPFKFLNVNNREIGDKAIQSTELSHDIFSRVQPHLHSWIKLYGKTFLIWHGSQPELIVTDVDLIKQILNNKDGSIGQPKLSGPLKKLFGSGLPFWEGQKWSKLRKVAESAFHGQSLKDMIPAMIESVETMLKTWKSYEGKEIEVHDQFRVMSSEIISRTAFGSSYLDGKQIFHMLEKSAATVLMSVGKTKIPGINKFFRTPEDIEIDKLREALRDSIMSLIKKREDSVKVGQTDSYGSDFLGSLLKAHHDADEKTRISVDDIIDECKTFYFAGHEPTNALLSWCVFLLAIHTDWQENARKEVLELFGQDNPKTDTISRLKIVGMVINESLRLYSPGVFIMRRVTRKTRLRKLTLPAGIDLQISPLAVLHNSELWGEDAHLFKPERFAEGVAKAKFDQLMALLPFGFGPRKCVGSTFAILEVKIALSMILQRYKFTLSPNYSHLPSVVFSLGPAQGMQIMLHPL